MREADLNPAIVHQSLDHIVAEFCAGDAIWRGISRRATDWRPVILSKMSAPSTAFELQYAPVYEKSSSTITIS
jgi:hypothetical protein